MDYKNNFCYNSPTVPLLKEVFNNSRFNQIFVITFFTKGIVNVFHEWRFHTDILEYLRAILLAISKPYLAGIPSEQWLPGVLVMVCIVLSLGLSTQQEPMLPVTRYIGITVTIMYNPSNSTKRWSATRIHIWSKDIFSVYGVLIRYLKLTKLDNIYCCTKVIR